MNSTTSKLALVGLLALASLCVPAVEAAAQSAQTLYTRALARERGLRDDGRTATLKQLRAAVSSYENLVHRFPTSPYCDNALWQGGNLALLAYDEYKQASDRKTGLRLLGLLRSQYPSSSLVARATAIVRQRERGSAATAPAAAAAAPTAAPVGPPLPVEPTITATPLDIPDPVVKSSPPAAAPAMACGSPWRWTARPPSVPSGLKTRSACSST
jgi:hypothetical protein